jgi:hypothetical protein
MVPAMIVDGDEQTPVPPLWLTLHLYETPHPRKRAVYISPESHSLPNHSFRPIRILHSLSSLWLLSPSDPLTTSPLSIHYVHPPHSLSSLVALS